MLISTVEEGVHAVRIAIPACLIVAALFLPPQVGAAPPHPGLPGMPDPKVMVGDPGRFGGMFLQAQVSDPRTFNPVLVQETTSGGPIGNIFDGLVEENGVTTEVEPALAESWTTSKDGRIWTFKLRQGLQWSDGAPLTADDVVFTFQVIYDKNIANSLKDVLTVAGKPIQVSKVDALTVRFQTALPFGPFLHQIGVSILPRHKLDAAYQAGKYNQTWGVDTPVKDLVGTGPYIMTEYKQAQRFSYERNPRYWKVDVAGHRLPYIDHVVLSIVPNMNAERLLFQQGQTDSYGVRPREYAEFKRGEKAGNYTVYNGGPGFGSEFLAFNQNPRSGLPAYELKWYENQRFRQGIAFAIDRQAIIDQVYAGHAIPEYGPESPADKFFFNPNVMQYPYNLEKAAATLAEAGFKKGPDGVLRDGEGHPVKFVISSNADNPDRVAIANIIRQDLEKLGMQVTLAPEAFNTLVNKLVESFKWETVVLGLTGGIDPHSGQNVWKSSGSLHMWNPKQSSPATPWEAEVDRYFDLGATTVDQNRRKAYYDKYQEVIAEQVPVVYTVIPNAYVAVRNKFGNIRYTAFGGPFWNLPVIFIKP